MKDITQKHQIILVGGGEIFDNNEEYLIYLKEYPYDLFEKGKSWKNWLLSGLSDNFDGIRVNMPNTQNAYYPAWKIWFEKYFNYLGDNKIILIGHSLGGIFLAKYLSENTFPKTIDSLHLVSPVFDKNGLNGESVGSFKFDPNNLINIQKKVKNTHIWHSHDDNIVPFEHSMKFHTHIEGSILHTFEDRGHFANQSHFVELFIEIHNNK